MVWGFENLVLKSNLGQTTRPNHQLVNVQGGISQLPKPESTFASHLVPGANEFYHDQSGRSKGKQAPFWL